MLEEISIDSKISKENLIEMFFSNVEMKSNGCFLWLGNKNALGYGTLYYKKNWMAHRFIFVLINGPFNKSLFVCHKCDIPSCVNPKHLFLGTQKQNMMDAKNKARLLLSGLSIYPKF